MPDTRRGCGTCKWGVRQPAFCATVDCCVDGHPPPTKSLAGDCDRYEYAAEQHVGSITYAETVPGGLDEYCLNRCGPDAVCPIHNPVMAGAT